eukprot:12212105-Heterocapsa_arctica.AAC.1
MGQQVKVVDGINAEMSSGAAGAITAHRMAGSTPRSVSTSDWEYELGSTATGTTSSSCRTQ